MHAMPKISFYIYPLHLLNYMYDATTTYNKQWWINRNWGLRAPFQSNFFYFHAVFSKIMPNNRLTSPSGLVPPLALVPSLGNLGSATDNVTSFEFVFDGCVRGLNDQNSVSFILTVDSQSMRTCEPFPYRFPDWTNTESTNKCDHISLSLLNHTHITALIPSRTREFFFCGFWFGDREMARFIWARGQAILSINTVISWNCWQMIFWWFHTVSKRFQAGWISFIRSAKENKENTECIGRCLCLL